MQPVKTAKMKKYIWLLCALPVLFSSCSRLFGKRVRGDGNIQTQERTVASFKNVEVSGSIKVYVSQGALQPVKIETDENLLKYIEVEQEGDQISIREKPGFNLEPSADLKVMVTSPVYNKIEVSGACDIIGQSKLTNPEDLELHVSGAGDITMEADAPSISAEISGSGSINLKGQTRTTDLELSGAAQAHCFDLLSETTKVNISGAGDAQVYASVKLEAEVSGAGMVTYKGNAASVNQNVSGAGTVKKAD